jgi:hypothetical protein
MDKTKIQLDKDKFLIIEVDTHANEHEGVHVDMYLDFNGNKEQLIKVINEPDGDNLYLWKNPNSDKAAVILPL